jgi:hypothetical protein
VHLRTVFRAVADPLDGRLLPFSRRATVSGRARKVVLSFDSLPVQECYELKKDRVDRKHMSLYLTRKCQRIQ